MAPSAQGTSCTPSPPGPRLLNRQQGVEIVQAALTLEPDVAGLVREARERDGRSLKDVVNGALRRGLASGRPRSTSFKVTPHESALAPGLDPRGFNQLAEELEDEVLLSRAVRRGR